MSPLGLVSLPLGDIFGALDALHPDLSGDDPRWVRCAVYTRQSVSDLARLAELFERHRVGLTIVSGNIDADAGSLAGLQVNMLATFAEWERHVGEEPARGRRAPARGDRARPPRSRGRGQGGRVDRRRAPRSKTITTSRAGRIPRDLRTSG